MYTEATVYSYKVVTFDLGTQKCSTEKYLVIFQSN